MRIGPELQARLESSDPGEFIDVAFVLDGAVIQDTEPLPDDLSLAKHRSRNAEIAGRLIQQIADRAARDSNCEIAELVVFEYMASARLTAPAALIRALIDDPGVATIGLA